jgi:predicted secreted hydrolase
VNKGACAALVAFLLLAASALLRAADYPDVVPGYDIAFPRDEGSHPEFRTEWWYVTGWLQDERGEWRGFQVTFFRSRPGLDEANPSRFAARQMLFAHAAISDPRRGRLLRAEKVARAGFGLAEAATDRLDVSIDKWSLRAADARTYRASVQAEDIAMELEFEQTQAPLLQGTQGFSQKGPQPRSASYYYSFPQLRATGRIRIGRDEHRVSGSAWLDHEWSSAIMDEQARGWDWVGVNLADGGALMAFRMRDGQGGEHWAAATLRATEVRTFAPAEVDWTPVRHWRSPSTDIAYPVEWSLRVGDRRITLRPLMDDQENDARRSTGTLYWEGAVHALDERGQSIGRGYLELTGYGGRVRF